MIPDESTGNERPSLEEMKALVSAQFLGKQGIHGVGMKKANNAVRIYIHDANKPAEEMLAAIQDLCAPYAVDVVHEQPPHRLSARPERSEQNPSAPDSLKPPDV